jgi:adenosylhomocysteine nucleosidase
MRRRVLVVAAEEFELAPLRKVVAGREDTDYVFVANGPGPRLAREAVKSAGMPISFDAFVSVGLCGALSDELSIGSIVVGNGVNGVPLADARGSVLPSGCRTATVREHCSIGAIASVDYVAGTIEEKQRLRKTGAIAVEMEAAAVLELAREVARPFYCVKAVSDVASESFALDLNAARDRDGRFSVMRILGQAFRSPATGFPELARLKRHGERAANALGEFFAHCNF